MRKRIRVTDSAAACSRGNAARFRLFLSILFLTVFCDIGIAIGGGRVVVLSEPNASIYQQAVTGFQQGFAGAGEVQQVRMSGDPQQLDSQIAALRKNPPNLLVAIGTEAALAAKNRLRGVPILYCLVVRPVQNKLVGQDIGGIKLNVGLSEQFANIQKALPGIRSIGVVYDEIATGSTVRQARRYLNPGVRLVARDVRNAREAAEAISGMAGTIDAYWLLLDGVVANPANFKLLVEFSIANKVALISPSVPFVAAGALLSVEADYLETGRKTAKMARDILDGKARAGDFVAEAPIGPVLTVNAEVARRLGITIPHHIPASILSPP
ncbi:MAG: ABC transporter substrate-binding protein [Bryobacteraceae bacterium]